MDPRGRTRYNEATQPLRAARRETMAFSFIPKEEKFFKDSGELITILGKWNVVKLMA